MFSEDERPGLKCGWVPASQWPPGAVTNPVPGEGPDEPECCPGYLVQLPAVLETARAHSWKTDGAIRDFYEDGPTDLAKDCIDIFATEAKLVEGYAMREATKKGRSNG